MQTRTRGCGRIESFLPFCGRLARLPHAFVLTVIWERGSGIAGVISGYSVLELDHGVRALKFA